MTRGPVGEADHMGRRTVIAACVPFRTANRKTSMDDGREFPYAAVG